MTRKRNTLHTVVAGAILTLWILFIVGLVAEEFGGAHWLFTN